MLQTQPDPTQHLQNLLRGVIHQYMDTLCAFQKQTTLTHSLLQDITVFNDQDSSKLEEWLTDIETAADLKK